MSEKELSQANAETPEETSTAAAHTTSAFQLSVRDDNIAVITIDVVGDSMNTLKAEFAGQFRAAMQQVKSQPAIQGLVLISGKKDSFIAGADVSMLAACENEADAEALSKEGHRLFAELEQMPIPVVAAIHGPCLGGGLELAMAAHSRVCTDHPKTVLGLPEVQLGLLPGSGGTQRLPRLVGIAKSLDMMLTGKQLRAKQALKAGLVDDVVPASILLEAAVKLALKGKPGPRQPRLNMVGKLLESNPVGRHILFDQALKQTRAKTRGNYPAPEMILECVRTGVSEGASGFDLEARRFAQLVMSPESEQLRNIFFATTEMKKETGADGVEPARVRKALVLGGGLMGGGISYVTATKAGLPVRVKDIAHQGISHALKYSFDLLNKKVKRRFMRRSEMQKQLSLISGTTDYVGVHDADMVVEAVFEDLKVKQQMVRDVEANCGEHTIFASNTSSLPIHQIAEAAERPQNVIGLHYFSPVDKMPLVEVIAHDKTSPETIATTVAFARKQGKTPIVVKDGAGFYVNRILAPYMNEAANLLLEGEPVDSIDRALKDFGFPVGPFNLLDEVGIDVGSKIGPILQAELGERFAAPAAFDKLLADGRKGRKSNKGFYLYQDSSPLKRIPLLKGKAKKPVDESVYRVLGVSPTGTTAAPELAQRCAVQMLNEAVRCLEEGIIRSPRDGDIGAIFGIGFPPFLGGPFHYIDTLGAAKLVTILEGYQKRFGERYAPAQRLLEMADSGERFYPKR